MDNNNYSKRKKYFNLIKYYALVFVISFFPIAALNILFYNKVSELVSWIINTALVIVALTIGYGISVLIKRKKIEKQSNNTKKDPFSK